MFVIEELCVISLVCQSLAFGSSTANHDMLPVSTKTQLILLLTLISYFIHIKSDIDRLFTFFSLDVLPHVLGTAYTVFVNMQC